MIYSWKTHHDFVLQIAESETQPNLILRQDYEDGHVPLTDAQMQGFITLGSVVGKIRMSIKWGQELQTVVK